MRRLAKWVLDWCVVRALEYVLSSLYTNRESYRALGGIYGIAAIRALETSFDYAERAMPSALIFARRPDLWSYALARICIDGINAEFGVFKGYSINFFAKRLPAIYGFDSFEGLANDWSGWNLPRGTFNLAGRLPRVRKNVQLIRGWFNVTIPEFLRRNAGPFAFVHIDCDTYEATREILAAIGPRLVAGTVIVFDEFFGYRGWQLGEFRAWREYVESSGIRYKYAGFTSQQVVVQVLAAGQTNVKRGSLESVVGYEVAGEGEGP